MTDFLRIVDWSRRQHFRYRRPPWIRAYADRTDPRTLEGYAFSKLSPDAQRLLHILELFASRQEVPGRVANDPGWLAYELRVLNMTRRQVAKAIAELTADFVVLFTLDEEKITLNSDIRIHDGTGNSDINFASVDSVVKNTSPIHGGCRGVEAELSPVLQGVPPELLLAVEHYRLAAASAGWPGIRDASLRRIADLFAEVTADVAAEVRDDPHYPADVPFDWLACFDRARQMPYLGKRNIPSFGFEWFLRREFHSGGRSGARWNALKVWDWSWPREDSSSCGVCAACVEGLASQCARRKAVGE